MEKWETDPSIEEEWAEIEVEVSETTLYRHPPIYGYVAPDGGP